MTTVKLQGLKGYYTHMLILSIASINDVSLSQNFRNHFSNAERKLGVIDQVKYK